MKFSKLSGPIYIDDNDPSCNWSVAKDAGICNGSGTYSEPYVIEDLVVDCGGSGSCIWIENSDVYFKIENCSLYNANNAGIRLEHVNNGQLIDNNCSSNYFGIQSSNSNNNSISGNTANYNDNRGIYLYNSINNTISGNNVIYNTYRGISLWASDSNTFSGNIANNNQWSGIDLLDSDYNNITGNTANNNQWLGIDLLDSDYNTISGNTANNNTSSGISPSGDYNNASGNTVNYNRYGIYLSGYSNNTTVSGNIMNECGLCLEASSNIINYSHNIDTTNLVNGKPVYYYMNEVNLGPNNFTNAGQVILVNCNDSLISNLNVSHSSTGITLFYSNNNSISGNTANDNIVHGIFLTFSCYNNDISGNIANNNEYGIMLILSNNNDISGNTANYNRYGIMLIFSNKNDISGNILMGNDECIAEDYCQGNTFRDNEYCDYGELRGISLELIILISIIIGGAVIGIATLLLIRRKRKRIQ